MLKYHHLSILDGPPAEELKRAFVKVSKTNNPLVHFTISGKPNLMHVRIKGLIYIDNSFDKFMVFAEIVNSHSLEDWGLSSTKVRFQYDATQRKGRFVEDVSSSDKN